MAVCTHRYCHMCISQLEVHKKHWKCLGSLVGKSVCYAVMKVLCFLSINRVAMFFLLRVYEIIMSSIDFFSFSFWSVTVECVFLVHRDSKLCDTVSFTGLTALTARCTDYS